MTVNIAEKVSEATKAGAQCGLQSIQACCSQGAFRGVASRDVMCMDALTHIQTNWRPK